MTKVYRIKVKFTDDPVIEIRAKNIADALIRFNRETGKNCRYCDVRVG